MQMNEHDIDRALEVIERKSPEHLRFVKFLSDWRGTINANSDGWPYWAAGRKCSERLQTLVEDLMTVLRDGRGETAPEAEFLKALTPIRSAATRFKLEAPELGSEHSEEPAAFGR